MSMAAACLVIPLRTVAFKQHEKCQEGSKGGNGIFPILVVLPVVGSKAILNHTRLICLQADGEGESGATSKIL